MDGKMNVLNVQLDDYTAKDAMKAVTEYMHTEPVNTVEILTVDILMKAAQTEGLKEDIEQLDLVIAGDESILEAAEVTEKKKLQEAHNQVFMKLVFHYFHKNRSRVFLLTDLPEETQKLEQFLQSEYTGIQIAGTACVPEDESAYDLITNQINGAEVDCVLSSMVSPKQEEFIRRCKNLLNTRLWLGIGTESGIMTQKETWRVRFREFLIRKILKREVEKDKKKVSNNFQLEK